MKAIILAAGRGSRMNGGTADIPKCMMKLYGMTLLDHCMESLLSAGFARSDIGIVTGYKCEKIQVEGVRYFHNPDWERTNIFVSLTMAKEWLQTDSCIVSYSDIVYHPNVVRKLVNTGGDFSITSYTGYWDLWSKRFANPLEDLESFRLFDGRLAEIGKKPTSKDDVQGQYMGLLHFTPRGWGIIEEAVKKQMPKSPERLDMTTLLQHLLTLGYTVNAIPTDELWLECDNQNDIQLYEKEFFNRSVAL